MNGRHRDTSNGKHSLRIIPRSTVSECKLVVAGLDAQGYDLAIRPNSEMSTEEMQLAP